MSDLKLYIKKRKAADKTFAKNYDEGYTEFKIGNMLRDLRQEAGLTQGDLAAVLRRLLTRLYRASCFW
jgi:HTH-type transcriptional regulator/antitoxin HipB